MANESLKTLFVDQVRDLYNAEQQLIEALPKMAQTANSKDLQQTFEEHLGQTRVHIERLDQIFQSVGEAPSGKKCEAMAGLIQESDEAMQQYSDAEVRDAAMIAAAQRVEHYEIAGYGTVQTFAELLGLNEAAMTLQQTLDEESAADEKLTKVATGGVFSKGVDQKAMS